MREIKFRAWHKQDGYMVYPKDCTKFEINFSCKFKGFSFYFVWGDGVSAVLGSDKHITLMQYAGLKDKNGKEIYEGDIINADGYKSEIGNVHIVEWGDCGFGSNIYKDFESLSKYRDIEVIGNIYENPELI